MAFVIKAISAEKQKGLKSVSVENRRRTLKPDIRDDSSLRHGD